MQDARARWAVALATLVVIGSGCAGAGGSPESVSTKRPSSAAARNVDPDPVAATSPAPAPAPAPPSTTVATRAATVAPVAAPEPVQPPQPTVTIAARANASISRNDDHPCSNISSQSIARGELEVRRSGPTDGALTVTYGASGIAGDYQPLPGQITIPAGAASAVVIVDPTMTFPAPPAHVHRSSSLAVTLNDGAAYDVGPEFSAAIGLRFDVDAYGCAEAAA